MKIFYAVQATGNGHVSRANEILPYLSKYGDVDIFLSGSNYALKTNLPIAYRSKGLSLEYNQENGSIDVLKTIKNSRLKKIWREAKHLPIEKYDLVINDFECITSLACILKGIDSVHFGHQASFKSKLVPRPDKKDFIGELVLANYAKGTKTIGLHFKNYDKFIHQPIIKKSILEATPIDNKHITVYVSQYKLSHLVKIFSQLKNFQFHIFSNSIDNISQTDNIKLLPISQELFTQSLISCHGIITGAGFETPAEALYLNKKLMVVPIAGQYEQCCNAAALNRDFNVMTVREMDEFFISYFNKWIFDDNVQKLEITESTEKIVSKIFSSDYSIQTNSIGSEHIPIIPPRWDVNVNYH